MLASSSLKSVISNEVCTSTSTFSPPTITGIVSDFISGVVDSSVVSVPESSCGKFSSSTSITFRIFRVCTEPSNLLTLLSNSSTGAINIALIQCVSVCAATIFTLETLPSESVHVIVDAVAAAPLTVVCTTVGVSHLESFWVNSDGSFGCSFVRSIIAKVMTWVGSPDSIPPGATVAIVPSGICIAIPDQPNGNSILTPTSSFEYFPLTSSIWGMLGIPPDCA